jgi:hypothetical protein
VRTLFVIVMIVMSALPAAAQPAADPAGCAAIAGDAERLACYDAIFRVPAVPPADAVIIESNQPIPARPTGRAPATMTIACTEQGVSVGFAFAGQLLSETSDDAALSFQVQQTGNVVRNLPVSADNTTIGFPAGAQSEAFLEMIEGGRNLQVRITPVRQRSLQVAFALQTHEAAIAALRDTCAS